MTYCKNKISVVFRFLLLLLFVGYYSSISLFYHAHLVNGVVIVHSHPFQKSLNNGPYQSHPHSTSAYILIHQLNQPQWENTPEMPPLPEPVVLLYEYRINNTYPFISAGAYSSTQLRAPPVA
jgi:hypothetical protein